MTDEDEAPDWPRNPMKVFQEFGEQATRQQQELFRQMVNADAEWPGGPELAAGGLTGLGGSGGPAGLGGLGGLSGTATFKTRVQSGGRISIPDAEREALDIAEGDIVQTIVIPVKRNRDTDE